MSRAAVSGQVTAEACLLALLVCLNVVVYNDSLFRSLVHIYPLLP